ncbi:364_t:CDS:2, partial [Gigaspora margarita]
HDESVKSSSQEIEFELDHNESVKSLSQELKAKLMIGKADEILPDYNILMRFPHAQLNKIFKDLDISQLGDVVLAILCNEIIMYENIAYQNYTQPQLEVIARIIDSGSIVALLK